MNRKSIIPIVIALFAVICQYAGGYERVADIVTTREGMIGDILGDDLLMIDSLSINGPINEEDFRVLWEASFRGSLLSLNLANAVVADGRVPDNAFWHEEEQRAEDGSIIPIRLESVYIGPSVKEIGEEAFSHARNLATLRFPTGLELFGRRAFYDCRSILFLSLPAGLRCLMPESMAGLCHFWGLWIWPVVPPELVFYEDDPDVGPFGRTSQKVVDDPDLEGATLSCIAFAPIESYKEYNKTAWTYFGAIHMMHDYDFLPYWDVTSVDGVAAAKKGFDIRGTGGSIEIAADAEVSGGTASIAVPAGIYIVRIGSLSAKIAVG